MEKPVKKNSLKRKTFQPTDKLRNYFIIQQNKFKDHKGIINYPENTFFLKAIVISLELNENFYWKWWFFFNYIWLLAASKYLIPKGRWKWLDSLSLYLSSVVIVISFVFFTYWFDHQFITDLLGTLMSFAKIG